MEVSDSAAACVLCDAGGFTVCAGLSQHFDDERHQEKMVALSWEVRKCVVIAGRACRLLSAPIVDDLETLQHQILHAAARDAVNTQLLHYLIEPPAASAEVEEEWFEQPVKKMRLCLSTEQLFLIGLAVWKAQCVWNMPPVTDYATAQEWIRLGWKSSKETLRDSNAMTIVTSSVRPFLEVR
jgi:hypothetical protein